VTRAKLDWDEGMKRVRLFPFDAEGPMVSPGVPKPDGMVMVGWDQNSAFPAYRVPGADGRGELVPFTPMAQFAPAGATGDFFVDHFTDAAIKARWAEAKRDPATRERILARVADLQIPHQFRGTGALDPRGRIDPHAERVDLAAIRRPGFFAAAPWNESIAALDGRTSIVEIEAPRESHETIHLGLTDSMRVRGWHIAGDGVSDGRGGRIKALAILVSGRNVETTGIYHPDDMPCYWDADHRAWLQKSYPNEDGRTETGGSRVWRTYIEAFATAGFDVLTIDKRGHGISGGRNDSNCNEQAMDLFRTLDALETGIGARILTPDGRLLEGRAAAGILLAGRGAREIPLVIAGASQGSMVTCWAMQKNCIGGCDFDRVAPTAAAPLGYNIKAGMILAPFGAGLGYRSPDDSLIEAARRVESNVQMFTSGEILGGIARWPAVFVGRGLWDFSESLEGSFECFRRATGPRMIVAVRGPHGEAEWGSGNTRFMQDRMTRFASTAVTGRPMQDYVEPASIRDVVAAAPQHWIETAKPL
jgi:pimeloyl-ACP methyl ester carboxylesterase